MRIVTAILGLALSVTTLTAVPAQAASDTGQDRAVRNYCMRFPMIPGCQR